jgi:hypothetical protein
VPLARAVAELRDLIQAVTVRAAAARRTRRAYDPGADSVRLARCGDSAVQVAWSVRDQSKRAAHDVSMYNRGAAGQG